MKFLQLVGAFIIFVLGGLKSQFDRRNNRIDRILEIMGEDIEGLENKVFPNNDLCEDCQIIESAKDTFEKDVIPMLENAYENGIEDFRVAMQSKKHFIIHPLNADGETIDVKWNSNSSDFELGYCSGMYLLTSQNQINFAIKEKLEDLDFVDNVVFFGKAAIIFRKEEERPGYLDFGEISKRIFAATE